MGVLSGPSYRYVSLIKALPYVLLSSGTRFFQADLVSHVLLRPLHVLRHAYSHHS